MFFDANHQPYPSERMTLGASNGVVATGNGLAAQAGLDMLKKGGNAVDAAIATAACLTVVEPTANGIGGDNFALIWMKGKVYGMNSNGPSPAAICLEAVKKEHDVMPVHGWTPVTVPGAPKGWASLSRRFGERPLSECLTPAIDYAENGFPVAAKTAALWKKSAAQFKTMFKGKAEFAEWFRTFTIDGEAPKPFQIMTMPNHARTLRLIGQTDADAFYKGRLADAIEADSIAHGGMLRKSDLVAFESEWVEPMKISYRGVDVVELPPSGQGLVPLMALNILKNRAVDRRDTDYYHDMFESMKMAFADGLHYITDKTAMKMDPQALISDAYGKRRFEQITNDAQIHTEDDPFRGGTVYLSCADRYGNMVSMIQSNYMGFGSGIVVKDTGIALHNRGADFKLDHDHINLLAPGKKTYHTIIPGMLLKDGQCAGVFGVMGAYMQPQGHVQVVSNLIDFHLNPQMALDGPRWQWLKGKTFVVEANFDQTIIEELRERGHIIDLDQDRTHFGRGQIILKLDGGVYAVGTESRTDSNVAIY